VSLRLTKLPGFETDFYDLPDDEVRKAAILKLIDVRDGRIRGQPLEKSTARANRRNARAARDAVGGTPENDSRASRSCGPFAGHPGKEALVLGLMSLARVP
jgi:hypothetical protein